METIELIQPSPDPEPDEVHYIEYIDCLLCVALFWIILISYFLAMAIPHISLSLTPLMASVVQIIMAELVSVFWIVVVVFIRVRHQSRQSTRWYGHN